MSLENTINEVNNPATTKSNSLEDKVKSGFIVRFSMGVTKAAYFAGTAALVSYLVGAFPVLMSIGMSAGEVLRLRKSKEKFSLKKIKPVAYAGLLTGLLAKTFFQNFVAPVNADSIYGKITRAMRIACLIPIFSLTANATNYFTSKYSPLSFAGRAGSDFYGMLRDYYNDRLRGKYVSTLRKAYKIIYPILSANAMFHIIKPELLMPGLAGLFRYKVQGQNSQLGNYQKTRASYAVNPA